MAERIPQSVAYLVVFRAFLGSDGKTVATGKTIAITISKNGGAFGNPNAGATNATEISSGFYKFTLDTTDTGTLGPLAWRGAEGTINDAGDVLTVAKATNAGFSALPDAAAEAAGGLFTRGAGAGQINQAASGMIDTNPVRLNNVAQSLLDLKDFADDGYDPATNKVQGVVLVDTLTTYTGNTPQTGDVFPLASTEIADIKAKTDNLPTDPADQSLIVAATDAIMTRLGAPAGASMSADIAAIEAQTDDIGVAGAGLTALGDTRIANLDAAISSRASQASVDDVPTNAELATALGTADDAVLAQVALVKAVTDKVDDTLEDDGGTFRFTTNALEQAPTGGSSPTAEEIADEVETRTIAGVTLVATVTTLTNLPAITANWLTAAGIADGALNGKGDWNIGKTGYALSAAGVQAIWDALTSALTTVGSIGKLLVDNINATISSRSSHSAADVWSVATRLLTAGTNIVLAKGTGVTGFNDLSAAQVNTEVDTAIADAALATAASVDALPTNAELATALGAADDAVLAAIAALNNLSAAGVRAAVGLAAANLDTQLSAIDAKTTNLPSDPADQSLIIAATNAITAAIAALNNLSAAQVKTQADQALLDVGLTAIITGRIDAAISSRLATAGYTAPDNAAIRDAVWAKVLESAGSLTAQQILQIVLSALAGVTSNGGATLKTPDGSATRISATINGSNERTAMTLTP